jgi:hypothetical protein
MQGHRHDHVNRQRNATPVVDHQVRQGHGQAVEAPVLERVHGLTQRTLKECHRPYAVNGQGRPLAPMTKLIVGRGKAAKRTKWGQYELNLPLALTAQRTANPIAVHATHWKKQRQQVSPNASRFA